MPETHVTDVTRVIQSALAPAFLLTAIASMLNVFTMRLARIVDRTRQLEARAEREEDATGEVAEELRFLQRRILIVRRALTLATGAALLVSLVIAVAFVGFVLQANVAMLVAGLFIAAMAALTLALAAFLREVLLAVGSLEVFLPAAIRQARRSMRRAGPSTGSGGSAAPSAGSATGPVSPATGPGGSAAPPPGPGPSAAPARPRS